MSEGRARWRCIVNAGATDKADRVIGRVREHLAVPLQDLAVEPYWKDQGQYEATFSTDLPGDEDPIVAGLRQAGRLSRRLVTSGPQESATGHSTISVVADKELTVPGLAWLEMETR